MRFLVTTLVCAMLATQAQADGFLGFGKKKEEEKVEEKAEQAPEYTPVVYKFEMPEDKDIKDLDLKVIYMPMLINIEGSAAGIEKQIDSFKTALNAGLKDVIQAKKLTIFHEIEDITALDTSSMSQADLIKLATAMNQQGDLDAMLNGVPYVKKKKSSAVIKNFLNISLKYNLEDSSNSLKAALVGNKIKKGHLFLAGEVAVEYVEPMTKEILIQQKFKLKEAKIPVQISYNDQSGMIKWTTGAQSGPKIYSTDHVKALDEALHLAYTDILKKYFEYLSPEELSDLSETIKELKAKKGY